MLSLQHCSAHSLTSLELLQPCLTEALQELTLRGLNLTQTTAVAATSPADSQCSLHSSNVDPRKQHVSRSCSCEATHYSCLACQLVEMLVEKCPALVKLDLQVIVWEQFTERWPSLSTQTKLRCKHSLRAQPDAAALEASMHQSASCIIVVDL